MRNPARGGLAKSKKIDRLFLEVAQAGIESWAENGFHILCKQAEGNATPSYVAGQPVDDYLDLRL
jgi:hypothetical protein